MKKWLSFILTLTLILALTFTVTTVALADTGGATAEQPDLVNGLINKAADVVQTVLLAAITIVGTWVSLRMDANAKLKNVGAAWKEAVNAAKLTVGELKQTFVDNIKASREDGKLTKDEIAKLNKDLITKTKEKMSKPSYDMLIAAAVDVEALILGAGEAWIEEIKRGTFPEGALLQGVVVDD